MSYEETELQGRLRRAKESLTYYAEVEARIRLELALAVENTKQARRRHEELLLKEADAEVARRLAEYGNGTK